MGGIVPPPYFKSGLEEPFQKGAVVTSPLVGGAKKRAFSPKERSALIRTLLVFKEELRRVC